MVIKQKAADKILINIMYFSPHRGQKRWVVSLAGG
jgi:hypothetical protein